MKKLKFIEENHKEWAEEVKSRLLNKDQKLDDEIFSDVRKIEYIEGNAIKLMNQTRETFDTHTNKATGLLTASVAIVTAVLVYLISNTDEVSSRVLWSVCVLIFSQLISMLFSVFVLYVKTGYYTYDPPNTYFKKNYVKENLAEMRFHNTLELQIAYEKRKLILARDTFNLKASQIAFLLSPMLGVIIFLISSLQA